MQPNIDKARSSKERNTQAWKLVVKAKIDARAPALQRPLHSLAMCNNKKIVARQQGFICKRNKGHMETWDEGKVEIPVRTCDMQQIRENERMAKNIYLRLVFGCGNSKH